MISAIAVLFLTAWPTRMAATLGNVRVDAYQPSQLAYHDPKSGYFLVKTLDCDGAHRQVLLTRDRRILVDMNYDTSRFGRAPMEFAEQKVIDRAFPLVANNKVKVGMGKTDVLRLLGKPSKTAIRGKNREFDCLLYKHVAMQSKEDGLVLRNTYIFKHGKLIEMSLNLDGIPGCGEDSLSDKGWPWTKF